MSRLAAIHLLASLTEEERADVERNCAWRRFEKGQTVVERGSDNHDVFFIANGDVEIVNYSLSGRPIAFARLGPGDYFGELSAIDGEPRSATVVASSDCLLGSLTQRHFLELASSRPEIGLAVMRRLATIIRACDERIVDLATLGAMQRVVSEICKAARPDPVTPGSWLIYPCPTQREFAARASTTRETVARVFSQLLESGQIRRKGRTVYLSDKDQLEALAQRLQHGRST